jgi:hypothetical protein
MYIIKDKKINIFCCSIAYKGNRTFPVGSRDKAAAAIAFAVIIIIRALLLSGSFEGASIEQVCARMAASPLSESGFISILTGVGVSVTTANELVACLKAAGILFNQVPT